jgi:hypothetical protein
MSRRSIRSCMAGMAITLASAVLSSAQVGRGQSSSASHVTAEMIQGTLNPSKSNAGDTFTVKLIDDLKSNGAVVLKKGTAITGVVRSVKQAETSGARSMIEIEWLAPTVQSRSVQEISIALQSFTAGGEADSEPEATHGNLPLSSPAVDARPAPSPVRTNAALLSMPFVMSVDQQTSSSIESSLTGSPSGPLFRLGKAQAVGSGGTQSIEVFSHLDNDTVVTSGSKEFEIAAGTRMQLLVGVNRK